MDLTKNKVKWYKRIILNKKEDKMKKEMQVQKESSAGIKERGLNTEQFGEQLEAVGYDERLAKKIAKNFSAFLGEERRIVSANQAEGIINLVFDRVKGRKGLTRLPVPEIRIYFYHPKHQRDGEGQMIIEEVIDNEHGKSVMIEKEIEAVRLEHSKILRTDELQLDTADRRIYFEKRQADGVITEITTGPL